MLTSVGTLRYTDEPIKLILEVDPGIGHLYRRLIPAYLNVRQPMWPAHISIVRKRTPPNMEAWGRYEGKQVEFQYESYVYNDELYYWLNCYSEELEAIRVELGLKPYGDVSVSPCGSHRFHCTVGNLKK